MIDHILVPLDGSPVAEGILPVAEELGRRLDAEVTLLQVVDLVPQAIVVEPGAGMVVDPDVITMQMDAEAEAAQTYLMGVTARLQSQGLKVRWVTQRGLAAPAIVDYARDNGVDLIAMSTHGRSGLGRLVFGSVADQVMRDAASPVLMIKPRREED